VTITEICSAVRDRFRAQVATAQGLNTFYDNAPIPAHTKGTVWCRFTVHTEQPIKLEAAIRKYRVRGAGTAQLFIPTNYGDGTLLELADKIVRAFRHLIVGDVIYELPAVMRAGQDEDEYQINVVCPFEVDTII